MSDLAWRLTCAQPDCGRQVLGRAQGAWLCPTHRREELWAEVEVDSLKHGHRPLTSNGYAEAWEKLKAAGCSGPMRFVGVRPDYEGKGKVRITWSCTRPRTNGQPMNPSGGAEDDASALHGLAQTSRGSGAGPYSGAREPDHPAPPACGRLAQSDSDQT